MIVNIWLILNSILYIGIGLLTFLNPQKVAATVGYILSTAGAYAELKACYGGLMISIGVIILYLLTKDRPMALLFTIIIYAGFGSGRLIGILVNKAYDSTTLTYIAFEVFATLFSIALYYATTKQ